jgi:valyl-tRNA synthetase
VEPNLSKQWFVSAKPLAEKAIAAVQKGETRIIPDTWKNTYFDWLTNIRDWCISRQIWWGHQIPAWTCPECEEVIVSMEPPTECPSCRHKTLVQETDVLDTWFSSALWPLSTMGWPEKTPLLKTFYPTSVLVTAFDILFFWVARMMMMGIHFMKAVPFKDVYVHALVRDEDGKKMSKSIGNVIDPLSIIASYGTDAFRFTLAAFAAQGRDIKMSEKRVEGYRHFINKIWNAARFALMHIKTGYEKFELDQLSLPNRWILSRLHHVTQTAAEAIDNYKFNEAAGVLYQFVWHEFCDWYLEIIKPVLYSKEYQGNQAQTVCVLWHVLRDILILLHPFIPFITEEIWQKLPGTQDSILQASFPRSDSGFLKKSSDPEADSKMELLKAVITGVRNVRGEMNIPPSLALDVLIHSNDSPTHNTIEQYQDIIINLARLKSLSVAQSMERPKGAATAIVNQATLFVSLEGIIDFAKEAGRLEKEIGKLGQDFDAVVKKLNNDDFLNKAPEAVVEKVKEKHKALLDKQQKLQAYLDRIKALET